MHPVDKRLAFLTLSATHVEFSVFAHLLRTRQRLEGCHDITARTAGHHHVEGIHCLEVVTLTKTVGACRDHHLIDSCSFFVHHDGMVAEAIYVSSQHIVVKTHESSLQCHFSLLHRCEREVAR